MAWIDLTVVDYFKALGPELDSQGVDSGEHFYESVLSPYYVAVDSRGDTLNLICDGIVGYSDAWLAGAFGPLGVAHTPAGVQVRMRVTSRDDAALEARIFTAVGVV